MKNFKLALAASALALASLSTFGAAQAAPLPLQLFTLQNGWTPYGSGTSKPSGALDANSIVHLRGALQQTSGSDTAAFVLPPNLRPSRVVYVPVDTVSATTGRLYIQTNGTVEIYGTVTQGNAQAFTSLEGVTYARN